MKNVLTLDREIELLDELRQLVGEMLESGIRELPMFLQELRRVLKELK